MVIGQPPPPQPPHPPQPFPLCPSLPSALRGALVIDQLPPPPYSAPSHLEGVLVLSQHQLHARLLLVRVGVRGTRGDGPVEVARKAMLLHGTRAKLREAVWQASGDGLGLVEDRVGAHVEDLVSSGLLPAGHAGAVQVDLGGAESVGGEDQVSCRHI